MPVPVPIGPILFPDPIYEVSPMALIAAGATAPDFKLDSHLDETISLADFRGKKNVLLVSYPLDFTPT
ncbi:hypothetical protein DRQ53_13920 [bacterium]|nr:MAG: hypothetical protein DRQ53_13920 [bacterium]